MEQAPVESAPVEMSFLDSLDFQLDPQPVQEIVQEPVVQEPVVEKEVISDDPLEDISTEEDATAKLPIDDDSEIDTSNMDDKAGRRFKELRNELKTFKTELETERAAKTQLEARLKELESADNTLDELKNKVNDYEQQLSIVKLEATQAYKQEVQEPLQFIVNNLDTIAEKYGINANELIDAVAISDQTAQDAAFEDLLVGVNERDKLKVYALADELTPVLARQQSLRENVHQALTELEERQQQQQEKAVLERVEKRREVNDIVARKLAQKVPFLKNDESIKFNEVTQKASDTDFDTLDDANKSYSYMSGLLVPKLVGQISTLRMDLEQALDEIADYKKSMPSVTGSNTGSNTASSSTGGSFMDAISRALG